MCLYLRNLINVLGLDDSLQIVLDDSLKVVLKLAAPEVVKDLLPVWGLVESAQIRLLLSRQNFQRRRLADPVGSNKSEDFSRSEKIILFILSEEVILVEN